MTLYNIVFFGSVGLSLMLACYIAEPDVTEDPLILKLNKCRSKLQNLNNSLHKLGELGIEKLKVDREFKLERIAAMDKDVKDMEMQLYKYKCSSWKKSLDLAIALFDDACSYIRTADRKPRHAIVLPKPYETSSDDKLSPDKVAMNVGYIMDYFIKLKNKKAQDLVSEKGAIEKLLGTMSQCMLDARWCKQQDDFETRLPGGAVFINKCLENETPTFPKDNRTRRSRKMRHGSRKKWLVPDRKKLLKYLVNQICKFDLNLSHEFFDKVAT